MTEKSKNQSASVLSINRKILYLALFIAVFFPILRPIGLPLTVTKPTEDLVKVVEAVPSGSTVYLSCDYGSLGHVEVTPENIVVIRRLIEKKVNIVTANFEMAEGAMWPPMIFEALSKELKENNFTYGVNYVFIGFLPGAATAMSAFAGNIRSVVKTDFYSTPIDELPLMKNINKITDFSMVIVTGSVSTPSG